MRPITLKMTAFGSYAEEAVVEFDRLRSGLYLITGDTGAGKTTIFDAIVFALFGEVSGSERKPLMMHSDLVDKSVRTVVELTFSQDGRRYTATRMIQFTKKRASGLYEDPKIQAELRGDGISPVTGASEVTHRCEELLGLNADQFRKIVMLAQGEFREFLKAPSEKKNEILGKLFDSSRYVYLEKLLFGARKLLSEQRESHSRALRDALSRLQLTDPTPETLACFLEQNPNLTDHLKSLIARETDRLHAVQKDGEQKRTELNALHRQFGEAEMNNRALEELEKAGSRAAELQAKEPEMTALRGTVVRAQIALNRAVPVIEAHNRASRELEKARQSEHSCEASVHALKIGLKAAAAACAEDASLQTAQQQARDRRLELDGQLEIFARLEQAERRFQGAKDQLYAKQKEAERVTEELAELEARITGLQEELAPLADSDSRVLLADYSAQEAKAALEAWIGRSGVAEALSALQERDRRYDLQYTAYQQTERKAAEANEYAYHCYRRFVDGQAGLLAGELRERLNAGESALCPVCGTRLTPEDLPRLSASETERVTQQTVEEARSVSELWETRRRKELEACHTEQSALESERTALLQRAQSIRADCGSWQQLCDLSWFRQASESLQTAADMAGKTLTDALSAQKKRNHLRRQLELAAASMEKGRGLQKQSERVFAEAEAAVRAAEAEANTLRSQLTSCSRAQAESERGRLISTERALSDRLKEHAEGLQTAEKKLADAEGMLKSASEARARAEEAMQEAGRSCETVLTETGFSGPEAVEAALLPCGAAPTRWIADRQTALDSYDRELSSCENRIRTLEEQTRGRARVDLTALQGQIDAADLDDRALTAASGELRSRLEANRAVLDSVEQEKQALADTEDAWRSLDEMGRFGIGIQSEGGKLSFDRYVMGAVFKEILEMANRRLAVISGGRYELIHKTAAGRANASAGLEIEVLDVTTGKQRPSGTLSGGEAFYTSLALALGLSDVVQNHAGGKKLDALFIDEGFGTLDDDMLVKALEVLNQLTEGNRLVGIISHVDRLEASITEKIKVTNHGARGSRLKLIL